MPTVMNGVSLNALTTVDTWSALSLFANGEQGAWYDPSDMSTMFQDAAGTTPVTTVEQPVGLILDKSKNLALGAELVNAGLNTLFTTVPSGFTVTSSEIQVNTAIGDQTTWGSAVVSGKTYRVSFEVFDYVAGSAAIRFGNPSSNDASYTANGTYTLLLNADGTSVTFRAAGGGPWQFKLRNISVREVPGNHANQSTAASRPVLSARVNLLTYSEQFDNAAWGKFAGWAVSPTPATDPIGGLTADAIIPTAGTTLPYTLRSVTVPAVDITMSYYIKQGTSGQRWVQLGDTNHTNGRAWFDLTNGVPGTKQAGIATSSITPIGTQGWFLIKVTLTKANTSCEYFIQPASADNNAGATILWNGTDSAFFVWGADLRVTNVGVNLPTYQRVGAAVSGTSGTISPPVAAVTGVPDYDTAGFPLYLKFDGVDDSLATGTINPGGDKSQVFAGVRKISGTGFQAAVGYGFTTAGSFYLYAPTSVKADYGIYATGNTGNNTKTTDATFTPPISGVVSGFIDGALAQATQVTMRVNGSSAALTAGGAMTLTSIGADIISLGRRQNSDLPFNGNLYGVIVRFGALSNSSQIENAENYINSKTKAY